jgi:hypothetical protein
MIQAHPNIRLCASHVDDVAENVGSHQWLVGAPVSVQADQIVAPERTSMNDLKIVPLLERR